MKQFEIARWLKGIVIILALMGLCVVFVVIPMAAKRLCNNYQELRDLYWPGMIYAWFLLFWCFRALYLFWGVCCEIEKDHSFSQENAIAFKKISRIGIIIALIWFAGILCLIPLKVVSIVLLILMMLAIVASVMVGVLAAALSHLIQKAYEVQQENELTI